MCSLLANWLQDPSLHWRSSRLRGYHFRGGLTNVHPSGARTQRSYRRRQIQYLIRIHCTDWHWPWMSPSSIFFRTSQWNSFLSIMYSSCRRGIRERWWRLQGRRLRKLWRYCSCSCSCLVSCSSFWFVWFWLIFPWRNLLLYDLSLNNRDFRI